MKCKRMWIMMTVLALLLLCCGCQKGDGSYSSHLEKVAQMEQTGEDTYISGIRTGIKRSGLVFGDHRFECTDDGVYYLAKAHYYDRETDVESMCGYCGYLFFSPHDSDTMIKLCGRPDCTHDVLTCDACFLSTAGGVCYYDGYLYIPVSPLDLSEETKTLFELYRVNLDGTNRVKIGSFADISIYRGIEQALISDGVFLYAVSRIDEETGKKDVDWFGYPLDNSRKEPLKLTRATPYINQAWMNDFITMKDGEMQNTVYQVDARKGTSTLVYEGDFSWGAYWDREYAYILEDNRVYRMYYRDGQKELLFDTGLQGTYFPKFFPDCVVLNQTEDAEGNLPEEPMLYFYSWEGECLGELAFQVPYTVPEISAVIVGESRDRLYLRTSNMANGLPEFYIEKSDFGTGEIRLHQIQYPDLGEAEKEEMFLGWE